MKAFYRAARTYLLIALLTLGTILGCQSKTPQPPQNNISPGIITLAKTTGMTEYAKQIFLEQSPKLIPSKSFYSQCNQSNQGHESSVLLGCFTTQSGEGQIFIQSITDQRLKGTMEITAAHEMLHAAFYRLSSDEKETLGAKLDQASQYYENSGVLPILQQYKQAAPEIYINELHSYLGTELQDLRDPELENYYQKYFKDRKSLVGLAKKYHNELYAFEAQAKTLKAEISALESYINREKEYLTNAVNDIKQFESNLAQKQQSIDAQLTQTQIRQGEYSSLESFDRVQAELRQASNKIETLIRDYQNRSLDYQEKVDEYNSKVNEFTELTKNQAEILQILQNRSR